MSDGTYSSKLTYLLSEFLQEISWEEIAEEIFFAFCFDGWGSNPGFSSNKPTNYLLDHEDFIRFKKNENRIKHPKQTTSRALLSDFRILIKDIHT